jgi:DNA-directed RNA polymerase specialized sigma24 family protein
MIGMPVTVVHRRGGQHGRGDLTEQQAADVLGIRAGTVKSQTSRALQRLRQLLDTSPAQAAGGRHDPP